MKKYDEEMVDLLTYVKPSKYRKDILKALENEKLKIPSEIAIEIGTITSHVSSHLTGLKERNLITCINENARKGRLYHITSKGKAVLKHLKTKENIDKK
ncbi:transcriptional regulator [Methanobrevibacter sp. TMH8]|uniref:transcriptional regulator n=1 Tax=Methanobrevibacter sp. TMH8 TaxID=2848611 RepID=UPI001CCE2ED7|nr:transcriptional regulator [Methanobrevibacter sp. TMH8]MBZ9570064.1 transcriptional regulator [Methanobrevibacter sp. TMH8]